MIGPAELSAGITSLRFAFDIAKGLKDIADATERNAKIMELQGAIMDAQAGAIEAQQAHATDVRHIADLEAEITHLKTWDGEKERYELKAIGSGAFVYALKPDVAAGEPSHWLCPNCYQKREKRILQADAPPMYADDRYWKCPACCARITAPFMSGPIFPLVG
jgi:hypothetical protein